MVAGLNRLSYSTNFIAFRKSTFTRRYYARYSVGVNVEGCNAFPFPVGRLSVPENFSKISKLLACLSLKHVTKIVDLFNITTIFVVKEN